MGCFKSKGEQKKQPRKIYIDLLNDEEPIIQPETYCENYIKTTNYTL